MDVSVAGCAWRTGGDTLHATRTTVATCRRKIKLWLLGLASTLLCFPCFFLCSSLLCSFFQFTRAELERYNHFVSRFDAHTKSVNFAEKTLMETSSKMVGLQEISGSNTLKVDFLYQAVDEVIECRRVLAWTYVYAFYLVSPVQFSPFWFVLKQCCLLCGTGCTRWSI